MDSTRTFSPPSLAIEYAIKQSSKQLKEKLKALEDLIHELEQSSAWRNASMIQQEDALIASAKSVHMESDKMRIALRDKAYCYLEDRYIDGLCMLQPAIDNMNIILTEILHAKNNPELAKITIEENLTKLNDRLSQASKRLDTPVAKWIGALSMFMGVVSALVGLFSSNITLVLTGTFATFFGSSLLGQSRVQRQSNVLKATGEQFSKQVSNLFFRPSDPEPGPSPNNEPTEESTQGVSQEANQETTQTESLYPKLEPFSPSPGR